MSELKSQIKYRTSRNEAFTGVSYTRSEENIHIIQFAMGILIISLFHIFRKVMKKEDFS